VREGEERGDGDGDCDDGDGDDGCGKSYLFQVDAVLLGLVGVVECNKERLIDEELVVELLLLMGWWW
jgi:hypothetical protein